MNFPINLTNLCFGTEQLKEIWIYFFFDILIPNTTTSVSGGSALEAPSLGLAQDLLTEDISTLAELMSIIDQMGLSHLFVSDALYCYVPTMRTVNT